MGNNDLTNFALTKRFYYFLFLSPPPNKSVYYTPFKVSAQSPAYLFEASLLFSSISDTLLSSMTFSPLLVHHLFPSSLSSTHPFFLLSLSSVVFRLFTEERGWKRLNQAILVGQGVDYHSLISLVTWKCPRLVHIGKKTPSPVDMDKPSNDFMEIDSDEMMSTREETTEDAMTLNNCNGDEHAFVAIFHPSFHLTKQTRRLCNFATMSKRQETSEKTTLNSCNGDVHPLGRQATKRNRSLNCGPSDSFVAINTSRMTNEISGRYSRGWKTENDGRHADCGTRAEHTFYDAMGVKKRKAEADSIEKPFILPPPPPLSHSPSSEEAKYGQESISNEEVSNESLKPFLSSFSSSSAFGIGLGSDECDLDLRIKSSSSS
ncbi:uncharacterized protein LOC18439063 isoform X2 [Amborella trichopoda]|uniref:uncharacterized protein LOC18439063 isoform X2 n=1 Tax=Amborella trichopoda TaxID=13333 RepID=UPI0009BF6B93|nr:uncharacterized protein LOC18439063 isoform X2 [Amborella trichopoda]|eukprot:XP_020525924.1 uncharacterized protein LOC18439063 isoform X2 [Amborella trichopoda]